MRKIPELGEMADDALTRPHLTALLAALEMNLARLVESRDPQTAELAHDLQKTIDRIRAELGQLQLKDVATGTATSTLHQHRK